MAQAIIASAGAGPLSDQQKDAIVVEAVTYAKMQPTARAEELARYFLPPIVEATGADAGALRELGRG